MSRIEKVHQYWHAQEPILESMYKRSLPLFFNEEESCEIISYLPDLSNQKILDLAAGIGRFTRHFSQKGSLVAAVDLASHFLQENKKQHSDCPNVSFICSDAMDLEFKENYFDFIFINWLFIYLDDNEIILLIDRMHRWLKAGGQLFLRETWNVKRKKNTKDGYYAHYRTLAFYEKILKGKFKIVKEGSMQSYIHHFADPHQAFWLCEKSD